MGGPGQQLSLHLLLRVVADVGIVGLPNAGACVCARARMLKGLHCGRYTYRGQPRCRGVCPCMRACVRACMCPLPALIQQDLPTCRLLPCPSRCLPNWPRLSHTHTTDSHPPVCTLVITAAARRQVLIAQGAHARVPGGCALPLHHPHAQPGRPGGWRAQGSAGRPTRLDRGCVQCWPPCRALLGVERLHVRQRWPTCQA